MKIAFILPSDAERQKIGLCNEAIVEMRQDQVRYLEHLLRSWRIFGVGGSYGINMTWRAIKRTLHEKP